MASVGGILSLKNESSQPMWNPMVINYMLDTNLENNMLDIIETVIS